MSEDEAGLTGNAREAPDAAPADARRRHADLSLEITEADHRYYVLDSPTISDIEPLETLPGQAVITPACGLAGSSPAQARATLMRCREAASMLPELIEETGGES